MGNCCKPFAREENREENSMEGLPVHNEGNPMESSLMYSEGDPIESLPTQNEGNQMESLLMYSEGDLIESVPTENEGNQMESLLMYSEGDLIESVPTENEGNQMESLLMHSEGDLIESVPTENEGNQMESFLMYSEGDPIESLPTENEGNQMESFLMYSEGDPIESLPTENEGNQMESLLMYCEGESSDRISRYSDTQAITTVPTHARNIENEMEQDQDDFRGYLPRFVSIDAELIAAGWPSWMVKDAGEALMGWVPRNVNSFLISNKLIGEGAYSIVYQAFDTEEMNMVALKKIKFNNLEPRTIRFMAREIAILRRLHHPNIIKLKGLVASENSCNFYLVLEHMEFDIQCLASRIGVKFYESRIKGFMKQLFCGLDYCHRQGILHRDIKSSNLLVDTNGNLKIGDFGLANFYDPQQGRPLTNQVVTLWYRPPELLLGATCYGAAVDLWSAGCILGELYKGEPILRGRTEVDQLHKIFTLCGSPPEDYWSLLQLPRKDIINHQKPFRRCIAEIFSDFPAPALALMETLLSLDPSARQSATHALNNEYFLTEPLPCEPKEQPQ